MGEHGSIEEKTLKDILGSFIDSYMERDGSVGFSDWLGNHLQRELPALSREDSCGSRIFSQEGQQRYEMRGMGRKILSKAPFYQYFRKNLYNFSTHLLTVEGAFRLVS